ncbi:MAG: hypothetical protein J6Z46_01585, partial [Lachnospiraceae bacterium]|nr:hypothetical protein [Lachnospiraceae bacterium]
GDEKHKQISTKASIARRRKKATEANARDISKSGYVSPEARQKYNDTKARVAEQFNAAKQKAKEMPSWERKKVQQDALNKRSKIKSM